MKWNSGRVTKWWAAILLLVTCSCVQSGPSGPERSVLRENKAAGPVVSVAISYIYEAETGNITELGNRYRDRIERDFKQKGYQVKARKDMVILLEDADTFGQDTAENSLWEAAGSDVVVLGNYTVSAGKASGEKSGITVNVKAYDTKTARLVEAYVIKDALDSGWVRLAARIHGNVHTKTFEAVAGTGRDNPSLTAALDRNPACYPPGGTAKIHVKSRPGTHIYIFNIAADNTVTLLYPNQLMADRPMGTADFVFPPPGLSGHVSMALYPFNPGESCQEAFKVIASPRPMDFSFLPVPMNQVFTGAAGVQIKKLNQMLEKNNGFNTVTLFYWVGMECR